MPDEEFRERLWPGVWFWLIALGMVAALAIAYGTAFGRPTGWVAFAAGCGLVMWLAFRVAVPLRVEPDGLRAGRAKLPWTAAGRVAALTADQMAVANGPSGDATAWIVSAPAVARRGIVVEVTDPLDPHRTWLVTSREPERLVRAIEAARGRLAR